MGELYERILGMHPTKPKIGVHALEAIIAEQRRGALTVAQADGILATEYGGGLGAGVGDEAGRQEVVDLLATIPTGTTTTNRLDRLERILQIEQVFLLADLRLAPYDTAAALRTRMGVPTR